MVNEFVDVMLERIEGIEWSEIGAKIAEGVNHAIKGIEWDDFGTLAGQLLGGALSAVATFIRDLDYGEILQAIQDFFSNAIQQIDFYDLLTVWGVAALVVALKKIILTHPLLAILVGAVLALGPELGNAIDKMISDIPWAEVGQNISQFLIATLNRLSEAIESVNWQKLGTDLWNALVDVVTNIQWGDLISKAFELLGAAVGAVIGLIVGFAKGIWESLKSAFESTKEYFSAYIEEAGGDIIKGLLNGIWNAIKNIGTWIYEHIFRPFIDGFCEAFGIASPSKVMEEQGGFIIDGLLGGITAAWGGIVDFFGGALDGLKATLGGAWEFISGAASDAWNGISTTLGGIVGGIASTIGDTWESVKNATSEKWNEVTSALGKTWENVKTAAGDKFKAVKETVSGAWDNIKTNASKSLGEVSKTVSGKWSAMKADASKAWDGLKTSVGQTLSGVKSESSSKIAEIVNETKAKWDRVKADASNAWNGVKSSVVPKAQEIRSGVANAFQGMQGTLSGIWGGIRSAASGALSSVSGAVSSMVSSISSRLSGIQSTVRNVTSATSDALSRTASQMDELARKNASAAVKVGGLASGGFVLDGGQIHKYASGTLRAAGSLFVAGEAGPEIVGHVNGRTEVLNESQIAGAIYSAVLAAMKEAVTTFGGWLSQQMASNTNALITAVGQIQTPQHITMSQDTALIERLSALQTVPYQVPAYATGTVMPYEVVAEIRRQTSEITSAIHSEGEEIIQAIVSAITNHGLSLANAIGKIPVNQGQSYSPGDMAQYTIDEINRRARMNGRSPLQS